MVSLVFIKEIPTTESFCFTGNFLVNPGFFCEALILDCSGTETESFFKFSIFLMMALYAVILFDTIVLCFSILFSLENKVTCWSKKYLFPSNIFSAST